MKDQPRREGQLECNVSKGQNVRQVWLSLVHHESADDQIEVSTNLYKTVRTCLGKRNVAVFLSVARVFLVVGEKRKNTNSESSKQYNSSSCFLIDDE